MRRARKRQPLTSRQQAIYDWIERFMGEHAYPPTMREIGDGFDIRSTHGVNDHLLALQRKGWIVREPHKSRALTLVAPIKGSCPHCGGSL